MPRFIRLVNNMIHVPSLSSVTMSAGCFGRPYLTLYYHNMKNVHTVKYKDWSICESDFNRVKKAMNEIEMMLSPVPLTTEVTTVVPTEPVKPAEVQTTTD